MIVVLGHSMQGSEPSLTYVDYLCEQAILSYDPEKSILLTVQSHEIAYFKWSFRAVSA